ncbi:MAG: winged helix-turn-helix transcriptional regulator [Actinomycetota bacterium]|nr:winged helix-turn-helix transcriptional regulator [Actinomycetota bacterium]
MAGKRTYGEACGIPRALDRVGERWALMIVRELLLGPKRFTDLRTGLPHLSPDVLSQRLRDLEEAGVLTRRKLPPPAASQVYELTEWGAELEPVVIALGRWGARAPMAPEGLGMSFDSHILSLRTLFEPALAEGFDATLELRLGDLPFRAEVTDGGFKVEPGEAPSADIVIETDAGTLIALVHGRRELAEAQEAGDVEIEGDREAVSRFLGLFPLPEPAA